MADYSEVISRVMAGDYDDASPDERDEAVQRMIELCSVSAGALALQPFPFLDVLLISPVQVGLVQAIGRIHGHHLDRKAVLEILASFGASIVAQNVTLAAAKLVPFFGWLVGIAMAYALTWAIGEVADYYFRTGRGASSAELQEMFDRVYKSKRAEKEASLKGNETLKDKLSQLKEAYAAELLTEEEFEAKKRDLLAQF